jgi:predicted nucleic acid-binding protein
MIVVADASPLNYLIQINSDELLQMLFGRVLLPVAVVEELRHPAAPSAVSAWLTRIPNWVEIRTVVSTEDVELARLDAGEREAILLAQQESADLLLIDERRGRQEAKRRGIATTGTLGVLLLAGSRKLADPEVALKRLLAETSFRASPELQQAFISQCKAL